MQNIVKGLRGYSPTNAGTMMDAETGEDDQGPGTIYYRADDVARLLADSVDYRALLRKYIKHVGEEEGVTFINRIDDNGGQFTLAELAALKREEER